MQVWRSSAPLSVRRVGTGGLTLLLLMLQRQRTVPDCRHRSAAAAAQLLNPPITVLYCTPWQLSAPLKLRAHRSDTGLARGSAPSSCWRAEHAQAKPPSHLGRSSVHEWRSSRAHEPAWRRMGVRQQAEVSPLAPLAAPVCEISLPASLSHRPCSRSRMPLTSLLEWDDSQRLSLPASAARSPSQLLCRFAARDRWRS